MNVVKPSVTEIAPADLERMLTSKEVAARLSISVETLYNWAMIGHGPKGRKMGPSKRSQTRYKLRDVIEWENNLPVSTRPSVHAAARQAANEHQ